VTKHALSWATSDGRERDGDQVVPAASAIKLFIASAFWRSELDPSEPAVAEMPPSASSGPWFAER